ncbi:MAG TPA: pirin family protein, partial [Rhodocyclaceae bacterium]|nr:pirin family protein [Rhodocyclaceae bacterium]
MSDVERIEARAVTLGEGMLVRRALPARQRRMIGAWCFLDHAGPANFAPGQGMQVGAHPHTALQTFSWLIEGEVLHRDSLGSEQVIRPGQVNLMTAGHGIVHTEDSLPECGRLHLAQLWIALPPEFADCAPAFEHYPGLPGWQQGAASLTLLAGEYAGRTSPARLYSPLLGLDICCATAAQLALPLRPDFEYGVLPLEGSGMLGGTAFVPGELLYLGMGDAPLVLELAAGSRVLLVGGQPFAEPVLMWWNFVGHSQEAISA